MKFSFFFDSTQSVGVSRHDSKTIAVSFTKWRHMVYLILTDSECIPHWLAISQHVHKVIFHSIHFFSFSRLCLGVFFLLLNFYLSVGVGHDHVYSMCGDVHVQTRTTYQIYILYDNEPLKICKIFNKSITSFSLLLKANVKKQQQQQQNIHSIYHQPQQVEMYWTFPKHIYHTWNHLYQ